MGSLLGRGIQRLPLGEGGWRKRRGRGGTRPFIKGCSACVERGCVTLGNSGIMWHWWLVMTYPDVAGPLGRWRYLVADTNSFFIAVLMHTLRKLFISKASEI